ncbi:MAG: response regulator [Candidatus Pacebacteria bacterium]|jgi:CheY-like chemotaxis protein|nr:response regulator [Candidatus Paceibacterota bacterium]
MNPTVFFVDDDTFLLDMYSLKFSKSGYDVKVSTSPDDAIKRLREGFTPDILLLDVVMPGMDGIELLGLIRKEKLIPNAVIIMLTNQSAPQDIERAQKYSVDGYITKAATIPSEVLSHVDEIYKRVKASKK